MSAPPPLEEALRAQNLDVLGGFALTPGEPVAGLPSRGSLVLIGPRDPGFWDAFQTTPEWRDRRPDPMDRWSRRVLEAVADTYGARAVFPFGGPPWHPFHDWALRSGRAWVSPIGMLVHDRAGLMVSYRGALVLAEGHALPASCEARAPRPCLSCAARPCLTRCPAGALSSEGYDVSACHDLLARRPDGPCMQGGCLARRACPVSAGYPRDPRQSAYHMERFHPSCP